MHKPFIQSQDTRISGVNFSFIKIIIITLSIFFLLLSASCHPGTRDDAVRITFKTNPGILAKWEDIFEYQGIVTFTFNDPGSEIFTIGDMMISPNGDYIILDSKARKVMQFDKNGKFIRYIGSKGEGPGEYSLAVAPFMDKDLNLYLYDVFKMRILKYLAPGYVYEKDIIIKKSIQDFSVDEQGHLVIYTTSDIPVLWKINQDGETVQRFFTPEEEKFRLFSSRFQLGRINDIQGKGFLFTYPEEYRIYWYDYDFRLVKEWVADEESQYIPGRAQYPKELSPFEFSPQHSRWWSESLRPAMVYPLGQKYLLYVVVKFKNLSTSLFFNVHDLEGNTYAVGLQMPFADMIRCVKDDMVYVVEDSKFDKDGNVVPLKLHRFKCRLQ